VLLLLTLLNRFCAAAANLNFSSFSAADAAAVMCSLLLQTCNVQLVLSVLLVIIIIPHCYASDIHQTPVLL
jgi:hypothetical protein